jgi:hypothetical protein
MMNAKENPVQSPRPPQADRREVSMKALSVRQPWAWLIVEGWKNIENRDWRTTFRGPVLIHAAKGMTKAEHEACRLFVAGFAPQLAKHLPWYQDLRFGGIVGQVTLLDCVTRHPSEWFCGPYGFVLADATPLPFVPCRGQLGFFDVELGVA